MTASVDSTADGERRRRASAAALRTVHEVSAGGIVVAGLDGPFGTQVAAIIGRMGRRGRTVWSLPKGHMERGERAESTAVREIAEETGIHGDVLAKLGDIDYWFVAENRRVHKTVHHYLLRYVSGELSDGDHEVGEVAWVPVADLPSRLAHAGEQRLARTATGLIELLRNRGPAALPPLPRTKPLRRNQTHSRAAP